MSNSNQIKINKAQSSDYFPFQFFILVNISGLLTHFNTSSLYINYKQFKSLYNICAINLINYLENNNIKFMYFY